jgi:hypothetical protein
VGDALLRFAFAAEADEGQIQQIPLTFTLRNRSDPRPKVFLTDGEIVPSSL